MTNATNYFKVEPLPVTVWVPAVGPESDDTDKGTEATLGRTSRDILRRVHTFFDGDPLSTEKAWNHAIAQAGGDRTKVSVARATKLPGPWRWVGIIGLAASRMPMTPERVRDLTDRAKGARLALVNVAQGSTDQGTLWQQCQADEEAARQASVDLEFCEAWRGAAA